MLRPLPNASIQGVPFIDLKRSLAGRTDSILTRWRSILDGTEFVSGPTVARLELALTSRSGCSGTVACANGTDALILALQASGIRPGMKVALPNLTFWATYEAVVQVGAVPILIDMDSEDLQMDLDELKLAHERFGLDGAITAHLFGWASPRLPDLRTYCLERDIRLIEDGAQAFGVTMKGKPILADSRLSTLSFYPAKVFGGAMDGGAVLGNDLEALKASRVLANHGRSDHYAYSSVGWNSRMSGLQAAFLLEMLDDVDNAIRSRNDAVRAYAGHAESAINGGLTRMWLPPEGISGNGYLSVFTVDPKLLGPVQESLKLSGVGYGRTYPSTIVDQPCVPAGTLRVSDLSRSRGFASSVINLPLFAYITAEEVEYAANAFLRALEGAS